MIEPSGRLTFADEIVDLLARFEAEWADSREERVTMIERRLALAYALGILQSEVENAAEVLATSPLFENAHPLDLFEAHCEAADTGPEKGTEHLRQALMERGWV